MADPYKDKVVLFLPMEGSHDGSTVFNDRTGKTVTRYGDTHLSIDVVPPFGATSAYFDGQSDDYLEINHPDLALGTGDFTVEYRAYSLNLTDNRGWFAFTANTGWPNAADGLMLGHHTSAGSVYNFFYGANSSTTFARALVSGWVHYAVVRRSGVTSILVDGVILGSVADTYDYTDTYLKVGGYYSTSYLWYGYMKDFRVTKGVARYTGNFHVDYKPLDWDTPEQPRIML